MQGLLQASSAMTTTNRWRWTHSRVEGPPGVYPAPYVLPAHAPFDLWDRNARHGVKLYVKRVFIMDDAEKPPPTHLRFVRGVVDSASTCRSTSRARSFQESKDIDAIRAGCTKKVLGLLEDPATNEDAAEKEKYASFWKEFGGSSKRAGEDHANKEKIAGLLRFASTQADTADEVVLLADHIGRMKEGQDKIYYVTAETFNAAKNSPTSRSSAEKGIEVLLLSDRVDEWVIGNLTEFDGQQLQSVARRPGLRTLEDEAEKQEAEKAADESGSARRRQASLGERVKEVRVTHRLTDRPPAWLPTNTTSA